ncbi:Ig-like domain-containing protein [Pseudomonas sp.]|uniref:Ig-like domain-containing protein n=1 Tax=Pseudomonas sp. TaxID=306 RepID=UPI002735983B|nr:Ig-like domain-containing protein [Pseudomonas sp.]MDP3813855.1 Ig-like domain-containing protein [Pseudomonas sp.]
MLSALLLILAGCVSRPQVSPVIAQLPERVELSEVPFFADDSYQGAPGALAALLAQQGLPGDPAQLSRALKLPQEEANLPANIVAEAQAQGLLVAPLQPNLTDLLHRVAAGTPVLLRFAGGYGVLVGYDRVAQTLLLQSGRQRRLSLDFGAFSQSWAASGQWAVSLLHPSQLPAPAAIPGELSPAAAREAAGNSSQALLALHKRWLRAEGPARDALRRQLVEQASQRRTLLGQLVQDHPSAVLQSLIPDDKQTGMPPEVLARLEQRLDLQGELEVLYEDYEDGTTKLRHQLKTPFGERFELHFGQLTQNWRSGLAVIAQGWLLLSDDPQPGAMQGDLLLADDQQALQLADGSTASGDGSGLAYDLPNTTGAQRTLVILVNFRDAPSVMPWTPSQASSLVLGTVSAFYLENSDQQTWLTGNVAGWYTIPVDSTVCDGFAIERYAKEAAQAGGYNLSLYDRFIYAFPQNVCGYSGMGQVGALPSSTWIHNSLTLRTVAHELGHNLGLYHAHALDCGDTTLGASCASQEYGDTLDIMGYSGTVGHFNGFHKERLGWLGSGNLVTVSSSGSFTLQPASVRTSAAKVLKIAKGLDASGSPSYYYAELRKPLGFDAQLTDRGVIDPNNVFSGIALRQASPSNGNSGYLLDTTAGSTFVDMKDPAITAGRSFSDSAAGVSLTTEWADSSQALVSVDLTGGGGDQVSCTRSAPQIGVSPAQSAWLVAGSSYSYSVSVSNKDSAGCSSSSFSLAAGKPSGWTTSLPGSLSLAPGASSSVSLAVTSPSSATDGFYAISSTATGNSTSATASATYVVDNPLSSNSPPVANNDTVVLSSTAAVTIAVRANDLDSDGDALTISAFGQGSKGAVKLGSNGTLIYTPVKGFKGSDQFSYSISDGKASASAIVSISLQSSGGGGKGKP